MIYVDIKGAVKVRNLSTKNQRIWDALALAEA